jgi:hypothetical protein
MLVAMHADTGRRYRAYPSPGQAGRLTGWGHSCRAVWNLALEQRRFAWRQRGRTVRSAEQCRHLIDARADLAWLADLPAQTAQQVLRQLVGVATATRSTPPNRLPGCGVDFGVACSAFVSDEREPRLMPPTGLHPQAHYRPRQEPRLGRRRRPAGEGYDQVGQGHEGGARQERQGQGRAESGRPRQRPVRAAAPVGVQGTQIRVGAAARSTSVHKPDLLGVWAL